MKKIIYILIVLFTSTIFAQNNNSNQTAYYYYYQGQKIYLNLNTQKLYIDAKSDFVANQLNNQGLLTFTLNDENEPINGEIKKWAKIELESQLTETEYFQKLDDLKLASTSIDLIQPSFITMDGDEIDMSSYLYVKLNQASDLTLLQQVANNKNVLIIEQNQFMPLWYTLRLTNQTNDNTLNISNYFFDTGYFSAVEPDFIFDNYLDCSNDPLFSTQWGLDNTENNVGDEGIDINICNAWDITTGSGINVAVVDSGFELNHPDLINNVSTLGFDAHTNSSPSVVRGRHGTAVAGIIGAEKDNDTGIAGVAPNCNLMSVSVSFGINQTTQQLADGINWAWQNGADIINKSWGVGTPSKLIIYAISNALNNDVVVVFSAGNDNSNVNYPANGDSRIIAVGAMSPCGERKNPSSCDGVCWDLEDVNDCNGGSNYGTKLDIMAPGVLISSTDRIGENGYSNGNYTLGFGGTSAAAPYIAGVAALILSVNPDLTIQEVKDIIESTAFKAGPNTYPITKPNGAWSFQMGYGLVNASLSVMLAENILNGECESDIIIIGPDELPYGQQATYTTNYAGVSNGVNWTTSQAFTIVSTNGEDEITIESTGIFNGTLTASIACMETTKEIIIYEQQEIVPYPNSSDISFNLDFTTYPPNTVYNIYIYDQNQNEVYSGESTNIEKTINTTDLPSGTFYLHVYVNGELTSKQLLVQH